MTGLNTSAGEAGSFLMPSYTVCTLMADLQGKCSPGCTVPCWDSVTADIYADICRILQVSVLFPSPSPGQKRHEKRAASFENRPDERRSGTTRNRTGDTRIFSPLLYQLSYGTILLQYFLVFVSTLPKLRCKGSAFILFLQTFLNIFPCVHIL